ncbi:MAG: hypothetical protein JXA42_07100 [Anaerolineales bacterium]|nr:hypothetical protein [Anaerolineales bacterium]
MKKPCPQAGDNRLLFLYAPFMYRSSPEYSSFLIRLWREPPPSHTIQEIGSEWLVQVEHIPGGEKQYFASLDDLFSFIRAQLPAPSQESFKTVDNTFVKGNQA